MTKNKNDVTIGDVYELIQDFRDEIKKDYVTKVEFLPIKSIVYGGVGLLLIWAGEKLLGVF